MPCCQHIYYYSYYHYFFFLIGGELESGKAVPPAPSVFKASLNNTSLVNTDDVIKAVNTGVSQILDARSKGRFIGTVPEPRAGLEGGHMPGALNLPFSLLVKEDDVTTFKSPVEIR